MLAPFAPPSYLVHPTETIEEAVREAIVASADRLAGEAVSEGDGASRGLNFLHEPDPDLSEVSIEGIAVDGDSVTFSIYDEMEGDTLLVRASVEAEVTFEGHIFKADFYVNNRHFRVMNPDWNDYTMIVTYSRTVTLWWNLTVITGTVEDINFDYGEPANVG